MGAEEQASAGRVERETARPLVPAEFAVEKGGEVLVARIETLEVLGVEQNADRGLDRPGFVRQRTATYQAVATEHVALAAFFHE